MAAQASGKYFRIRANQTSLGNYVRNGTLQEGLYFVQGDVKLNNDRIRRGRVTIVATGRIEFDLKDALLESFADNLLTYTTQNDCENPAIKLSARNNRWRGIIFAPNGLVEVHGDDEGNEWDDRDDHRNGNGRDDHDGRDDDRDDHCNWRTDNTTLVGALIGERVRINARNLQITGINSTNQISQPLISPLQCLVQGGELQLCFPTSKGMTYAVDYTDSLANPDWKLWCIVDGNGSTTTLRPPIGAAPQRYYRLRLQ